MRIVDFVQTRGLQDLKIVHYRGQVALKKDISTLRTALKSSEQQRYGKLPAASSSSAAIDADSFVKTNVAAVAMMYVANTACASLDDGVGLFEVEESDHFMKPVLIDKGDDAE